MENGHKILEAECEDTLLASSLKTVSRELAKYKLLPLLLLLFMSMG
jgi:hypothetical protein